jgi:hypothetical protein
MIEFTYQFVAEMSHYTRQESWLSWRHINLRGRSVVEFRRHLDRAVALDDLSRRLTLRIPWKMTDSMNGDLIECKLRLGIIVDLRGANTSRFRSWTKDGGRTSGNRPLPSINCIISRLRSTSLYLCTYPTEGGSFIECRISRVVTIRYLLASPFEWRIYFWVESIRVPRETIETARES